MSNFDDLDAALDQDYAEGWKPQPGEKLIGTVTAISSREGDYGRYPIITVKKEDGTEIAAHAFHDVLREELVNAKPQVGGRIAIKYVGQPAGKNYHVYRVRTDTPTDWNQFGDEPVAQAAQGDLDIPEPEPEPAATTAGGDDDIPF